MLNQTMSQYFGVREVEREIGLEIEMEAQNLPNILSYWGQHQDGSLRPPAGYQAIEYVFNSPKSKPGAFKALDYLKKKMLEAETQVFKSTTSSIHVHLNYTNKTWLEVINSVVLYYILEEVLVDWIGEERVGNLFCLRGKDAEHQLYELRNDILNLVKGSPYNNTSRDERRYMALNLASLRKFGSLEFRAFRGTDDFEVVKTWINILLSVRDSASRYQYPSDIIADFSSLGPEHFLRKVFPDEFNLFIPLDYSSKMYSGVRMIQDIAYCVNWQVEVNKKTSDKVKSFPYQIIDGVNEGLPPITTPRRGRRVAPRLGLNIGEPINFPDEEEEN